MSADSEIGRLLHELVVRQSALEKVLIDAKIIDEKAFMDAQLSCMLSIQKVIDVKVENLANESKVEADKLTSKPTGFVKFGNNETKENNA